MGITNPLKPSTLQLIFKYFEYHNDGSCLTPVFRPLILVQASLFLHKLPLLTTKCKSARITGLIFLAWFPSNFSNYRANSSLVRVSRETEWAHRLHHTWQGVSLAASAAVSTRLAGDGQRHTLITLQRSGLLPEQFSVEQDEHTACYFLLNIFLCAPRC